MSYEYKVEINYNRNDRKCEKGFRQKMTSSSFVTNKKLLIFGNIVKLKFNIVTSNIIILIFNKNGHYIHVVRNS